MTETMPPSRQRDALPPLDHLEIGAFRGLRDLHLDRLSRINLLVGLNNTGKTSVLEAIAVLQNAFDPIAWYEIASSREGRSASLFQDHMSALETLRWMFPAREGDLWIEEAPPQPIRIAGHAKADVDRIEITCETFKGIIEAEYLHKIPGLSYLLETQKRDKEKNNENKTISDHGLRLRTTALSSPDITSEEHNSREWLIWSRLGFQPITNRAKPRRSVEFLAPYAHRSSSTNLRRLSEATKHGWRDDIDALLRDLDPRIAGVEIITSGDDHLPKITAKMNNGAIMPLAVLGDGIRRALSIALALRIAAHGIVLIDEIEAALHIRAFDRLFQWMESAASSFSVQIHATTHSLEAIDAIARNTDATSYDSLSAYLLDTDQEGGAKRYTGEMLHRLVHQHGLDIRGW